MIQFQTASAQSAIDLGGVNVIYYSRLMEQISEYGNILSKEVDEPHGVNRKFHKYHPIDAFPMLDSDLDLSDDAIGSQFVKKIFPSFQEQMVAKHIRQFMNPDTSSREALPLVKKFLKDNPQGSTTSTGVRSGGPTTVTEKFYTFWQDEFPDVQSAPAPPRDVPSAPQGPSASTTTRTTMRSATVTIEGTVFSMKPLICILHTRAAVTRSKRSVARNLEVKTEHDIVRNGTAGDITHMIDKDTNAPFRGEVEQVQCDRLAMPRYAMCIRNLTLASMLANPSKEMLSTTRDVVLSDCGIRKIVDAYEVAMNAASLKGTSRVFPPEVVARSMIGVDEADIPRVLPNGRPDETITALKRLRTPDMPTAVDIRLEPTLVILDVHLVQSKNKTLQYFCEENGWGNIVVVDPYVRHGSYVPNDPIRTMNNLIAYVQGQILSAGKGGRQGGTGDDYANRRIHIFISFDELKKACEDKAMLDLVESIEELRKASQCICCVHVNEEAMSIDNSPMGAKLYAWISDTGVLAFRASGIARALKILWEKKFAFDDAVVPKAYAAWDLWMIRTSTVAFMLLDPSDIATITETFLIWARQAVVLCGARN